MGLISVVLVVVGALLIAVGLVAWSVEDMYGHGRNFVVYPRARTP